MRVIKKALVLNMVGWMERKKVLSIFIRCLALKLDFQNREHWGRVGVDTLL